MSEAKDQYDDMPIGSEWAVGGALFAACMLIMVGIFQGLAGIVALVDGLFVLAGRKWAIVVAIVIALLNAIENFFFIPYYPLWSILIIAIDVFIIWSLTRPGVIVRK